MPAAPRQHPVRADAVDWQGCVEHTCLTDEYTWRWVRKLNNQHAFRKIRKGKKMWEQDKENLTYAASLPADMYCKYNISARTHTCAYTWKLIAHENLCLAYWCFRSTEAFDSLKGTSAHLYAMSLLQYLLSLSSCLPLWGWRRSWASVLSWPDSKGRATEVSGSWLSLLSYSPWDRRQYYRTHTLTCARTHAPEEWPTTHSI